MMYIYIVYLIEILVDNHLSLLICMYLLFAYIFFYLLLMFIFYLNSGAMICLHAAVAK